MGCQAGDLWHLERGDFLTRRSFLFSFSFYFALSFLVTRSLRARPAIAASYSTLKTVAPLSDQDRIFTNLYGKHDYRLSGAKARVRTLYLPTS